MWKSFGGVKQIKSANINSQTVTTDNIILRKAYSGNFVIDGSIIVATDTEISGNLFVFNKTTLNDVCMNSLIVNNNTVLNGNIQSNQTLTGNSINTNTLETTGNAVFNSKVFLKNQHYLYGSSTGIGIDTINPSATFDICSNNVAGLNIHTSNSTNKNILACNNSNNGIILGADISGTSIDFFTNNDISNSANGDSYIHSSNGIITMKTATDTQILSNIVVSGSQNNFQKLHLSNETLALYDNIDPSGEYYFSNIYNTDISTNNYTKIGRSAAFISSDTSFNSVTNIYLSTNTQTNKKYGGSIVSGVYPASALSTKRSMLSYGLTDNNGKYMPTETIVQGSLNNTKYLATTGMNTYMPRTDKYVVDINGPVIIDNGDIVNVNNTNFEILDIKHAIDPSYSNCIMAIGASIDIPGSYIDKEGNIRYRYSVIFSNDNGATWNSTILYPSSDATISSSFNKILNGNFINQLDIYDCSYAFITGDKNTLIYTWNGGRSWQEIGLTVQSDLSFNGANYNAIKVKKQNNDILSLYLSVDISNNSKLITFDLSFDILNGIYFDKRNLTEYNTNIHINSIGLSNNKLYVAGDKIIIYNLSNLSVPIITFDTINSGESPAGIINKFIWKKIHVFNDNYAIAIANGLTDGDDGQNKIYGITKSLVSVIKNNLIYNWDSSQSFFSTVIYPDKTYLYPMNCVIKDIYINDLSNSILVGNCNDYLYPTQPPFNIGSQPPFNSSHVNGSFILISKNVYSVIDMSWNDMPSNMLNSSGKMNLLVSKIVSLDRITITNPNTLLFISTIKSSVLDPTKNNYILTGASNIFSCFTPNYLNSANNHVMDVCGNMSVYGSFFANSVSSTSAFQQLSDYRIKTDILPLPTGDILDKLRPVQYTNKLNGNCEWGFIAHELQEYLPQLVKGEKDGENYQSINYNGIIALLVREIQVLKNEINKLRN